MKLQWAEMKWVRAMLTWIVHPQSEGYPKTGLTRANWNDLKRAAMPLAQGKGISYKHLPGPPIFKGTKMDPRVYDAEEARRVARHWLPMPNDKTSERPLDYVTDASNGHTIDHVLGYKTRSPELTHLFS